MNISGVQNFLSNVFRPTYVYDTDQSIFVSRLQVSNIDNYSGNTISVFTAAVGDVNSNMYVGSNAGNLYNLTRNCVDVTAIGYGAGSNISNDSNSVYIGWYAGSSGSNSKDVISIGHNSGGNGSSNIFVGTNTGTVGLCNVLIGHYIDLPNVSNQIRIGCSNKIPIAADLGTKWVGLGGYLSPVFPNDKLDVSGNLFVLGNIGLNTEAGAEATLDVNGNFQSDDGNANLRFLTTDGVSQLSFSNYAGGSTKLNIGGQTKSSDGYSSIQGTVNVTTTTVIGPLKKGIVTVAAVAQGAVSGRAAYMYFAHTSSIASILSSNVAGVGDISIDTSGGNIQISNQGGAKTYDYSITYFPMP